jgi:hypothetical protein
MFQLLNDEPGHALVGPYESTDANVRTTKARSMAYLPYHLVGGSVWLQPHGQASLRAHCTRAH